MRVLSKRFDGPMATASYGLGSVVILLALATVVTGMSPAALASTVEQVFGPGFLLVYGLLLLAGLWFWREQCRAPDNPFWRDAGLQAASGIATLALTFTLLGISLGIGALAEQRLSPETVDDIIGTLTARFSMAFMTTVVGLPTAAALRALIVLTGVRHAPAHRDGDLS